MFLETKQTRRNFSMGEDCQSSIEGNGLIPGKGIVTWCPPKHILPQRNAGGHDLGGRGRAKEVCLLFFL